MNHCFSTRFGLTQVAPRLRKRDGWLPCQTSISAKLYKRCVRGSRRTGLLSHWLAEPGCRGLPLPLNLGTFLARRPSEILRSGGYEKKGQRFSPAKKRFLKCGKTLVTDMKDFFFAA